MKIFTISKDQLPSYVALFLKRKGVTYRFSFIFCPREHKEDFVLTYPQEQFPASGSIEIFISEVPAELREKDLHSVHIATGKDLEGTPFFTHSLYVLEYTKQSLVQQTLLVP